MDTKNITLAGNLIDEHREIKNAIDILGGDYGAITVWNVAKNIEIKIYSPATITLITDALNQRVKDIENKLETL